MKRPNSPFREPIDSVSYETAEAILVGAMVVAFWAISQLAVALPRTTNYDVNDIGLALGEMSEEGELQTQFALRHHP